MSDIDAAKAQAEAFRAAADASPFRHWRKLLASHAREWENAAKDLAELGDEAALELFGSVVPGMQVWGPNYDQCRVVGASRNGSIMYEKEYGGVGYVNRLSPASPVVVVA